LTAAEHHALLTTPESISMLTISDRELGFAALLLLLAVVLAVVFVPAIA